MVTITQLNPINVQFVIPEKDIPTILENQLDGEPLKVKVTVGDSSKKVYEGTVLVVDNQVDPSIAAVRVKAQIPNESLTLLPGQFARVSLVASDLKDAITVPSQAIVINPRGKFVFTLDKDGKASMVPVKVIYEYRGSSVITGIDSGAKVVVEGKQNLRPGSKTRETKSSEKVEQKKGPGPSEPPPAGSTPASAPSPSTTEKK
jgi:RND family efflux transporter MFP subunit